MNEMQWIAYSQLKNENFPDYILEQLLNDFRDDNRQKRNLCDISKAEVENALKESETTIDAAKMLNINEDEVYRLRKKYNLLTWKSINPKLVNIKLINSITDT